MSEVLPEILRPIPILDMPDFAAFCNIIKNFHQQQQNRDLYRGPPAGPVHMRRSRLSHGHTYCTVRTYVVGRAPSDPWSDLRCVGPTAAGPKSARARARRRRGCTCAAETRTDGGFCRLNPPAHPTRLRVAGCAPQPQAGGAEGADSKDGCRSQFGTSVFVTARTRPTPPGLRVPLGLGAGAVRAVCGPRPRLRRHSP